MLGRRWSYGGGAGVARRELCVAMATAEAGRSSLLRLRELRTAKEERENETVGAGRCGRVLA